MDAALNAEIWERLLKGRSLHGLGLGTVNGRLDLRGLQAPLPELGSSVPSPLKSVQVQMAGGVQRLVGRSWRSLDLTGSRLAKLHFVNCTVSDCVFDQADCREWHSWASSFADCSFARADLRHGMLGGIDGRTRSSFTDTRFSGADLRGTMYAAGAQFTRCLFASAKLRKVWFNASVFTDCIFQGELREVVFHHMDSYAAKAGMPANEMLRVDFRQARLRWTEFRLLNLDTVEFPVDQEHIVLSNYVPTIDRLVAAFEARSDLPSRQYAAVFANRRKWAGDHQRRGVPNKQDLLQIGAEEGLREVLAIVQQSEGDVKLLSRP